MFFNYRAKFKQIRENESDEWIVIRTFIALGTSLFSILPSLILLNLGFTDSEIGIAFSILSFIIIFVYLVFPYFLEKYNQIKSFRVMLFTGLIIYFLMAKSQNALYFLLLYFLLDVVLRFQFSIAEIQFRDVTGIKNLGKKRNYARFS